MPSPAPVASLPVRPGPRGRAFALPETAALAALAAVVAAILAVCGDSARRAARLGEDQANLRQLGAVTAAFGSDNAGQLWTFTWKAGQNPSSYPDLQFSASDVEAGANQAVDILRRVAGREDIPKITSWFSHLLYSHLMLYEYLDLEGGVPSRAFISPGDANRLLWAGDPAGFDEGKFGLKQPTPSAANKRFPYSASYQLSTSFYDISAVNDRIYQSGVHSAYITSTDTLLGGKLISATAFPSQKVLLHDPYAWHFGRYGPNNAYPFYAFKEARSPLLFVDGGVRVRATPTGNPGWLPINPSSPIPMTVSYAPATWEQPTVNGGSAQNATGYYRWTRNYIAGRDIGGPEIGPP